MPRKLMSDFIIDLRFPEDPREALIESMWFLRWKLRPIYFLAEFVVELPNNATLVFDDQYIGVIRRNTIGRDVDSSVISYEQYQEEIQLSLEEDGLLCEDGSMIFQMPGESPEESIARYIIENEGYYPELVQFPALDNLVACSDYQESLPPHLKIIAETGLTAHRLFFRLAHEVKLLQEACDQIEKNLDRLENSTLSALDDLTRTSWRSAVRLELIDPIVQWPLGKYDPNRKLDFSRPYYFAVTCLDEDPTQEWYRCLLKTYSYTNELIAIRGERDQLSSFPKDEESIPDGPIGIDAWAYQQVVYKKLARKPWLFAKALFEAMPYSVAFEEFSMSVMDDHAENVDSVKVGNWRSKANKFFMENQIPLRISVAGSFANMDKQSWPKEKSAE
jgi:hypothetical protein